MGAGRHPRATSRWASSRRSAARSTDLKAGRPRRDAVPDLLRALLHVRPAALHPVRDHPGPRPGHGRGAVRLLQALRRRSPAARPSTCGSRRRSSPHIKVPEGPPDDRFVYLSDVLPTAWQAVEYAGRPRRRHRRRARPRPDRRHGLPDRPAHGLPGHRRRPGARAARAGRARAASRSSTCDEHDDDLGDAIRDMTDGRGPGLGHRRGRHGGARLAGRASSRSRSPALLPGRRRRAVHAERPASTGSTRSTRRSTSCAAAAPSR